MPLNNSGNPECPNDHSTLRKAEGFYALTKVTKRGTNITFNPSSGIPVVVYVCNQCGYVEIYHAQSDDHWEQNT